MISYIVPLNPIGLLNFHSLKNIQSKFLDYLLRSLEMVGILVKTEVELDTTVFVMLVANI